MMTCAIAESPLLGGGAPLPHKPSSKGDFDFICRTDPRDFIMRNVNPPPPIYWRIISLVTDQVLARRP